MAIFTISSKPYDTPEAVSNALGYIADKTKTIHLSSCNMLTGPIDSMASQFLYYKKYYGKTAGKQLEHFVLSFDSLRWEDKVTLNDIDTCLTYISMNLFPEHQLVYSVHNNTEHLHVHIVMNTVSIADGKHFRLNKSNFYSFMTSIAQCLYMRNIALEHFSYYNEAGILCWGNNNISFLYMDKPATYNM